MRRDAGGAGRLGLRSEGASRETRNRHEAGDGAEVGAGGGALTEEGQKVLEGLLFLQNAA